MILVDSDVLIEHLRGNPAARELLAQAANFKTRNPKRGALDIAQATTPPRLEPGRTRMVMISPTESLAPPRQQPGEPAS